jgi:hypothetical protein
MPNISSSFAVVNPSYVEPGVILPYVQASGAFDCLADADLLVRLGDGDLYVYVKRLDIRTRVAAGQAAYNMLPSVSVAMSMINTASYEIRVRAEYDHHDTAAMGRWGLNIQDAQRLGMRQGHFQLARNALLYGFNPTFGEGLINAQGATAVSLPPDSNNNSTIVTYDNGELGVWLLTQISALKTRCNQLGIGRSFVILGPQRTLSAMEYQNIVQLVQFQRAGAGSTTTAGMVKDVVSMNDDTIIWVYDDTLIGKGAGGGNNDLVLLVMPEVKKSAVTGMVNTNEIAKLAPGIEACTLMYCDMAAPKEIPTPLVGGAIDVLSEWRITSGWGVRPETITAMTMQYQ